MSNDFEKDVVHITIYGAFSKIEGDAPWKEVYAACSYKVNGAEFSKAYKRGLWNGITYLINKKTGSFPSGLVNIVKEVCKEGGKEVYVHDRRIDPGSMSVYGKGSFELNNISMEGKYSYQLDACKAAVKEKQGILNICTGGGKSFIAAAVVNYLQLPTLYVVPSKELLHQTRKVFLDHIPNVTEKDVGIIGDGEWYVGGLVTIATIDTLASRVNTEECKELLDNTDVLIGDECFPLGTKIGDKNIESIKVGDFVESIDHITGKIVKRKVVRTFSKITKDPLITITTSKGKFTCTRNHPIFVKNKGYIKAEDLNGSDLLCVLLPFLSEKISTDIQILPKLPNTISEGVFSSTQEESSRFSLSNLPKRISVEYSKGFDRNTYLQQGMPTCIEKRHIQSFLRKNENEQSYEYARGSRESCIEITGDKAQASYKEGQRSRPDRMRTNNYERINGRGLDLQSCSKDQNGDKVRVPDLLQDRYSESYFNDCYRGRWSQPLPFGETETRSEKRRVLEWVRVESITSEKQRFEEGTRVYNLEVEGSHTYFAEGHLVHNCHYSASDSWYDILTCCNAYHRIGMSGTALDRTDGANLKVMALFGDVICKITNKQLVDSGVLPKAKIIFDRVAKPTLTGTKLKYNTVYDQGVVNNQYLTEKIVEWTKICVDQGLSVLIMVEHIKHGKIIDEALWNVEGSFIPHTFISGQADDKKNRREGFEAFDKREIPVLIATNILNTGVSSKAIDVLIPIYRKSKIRTIQGLGRTLRGEKAIVIEFANYCNKYLLEHSLTRLRDYKAEDCFDIVQSGPDADLIRRLWNGESK